MKREEAIRHSVKKSKDIFCKGCNAFETGIKRGISIADNSPLPSCVGNVIVEDLTDEELKKYKTDCRSAYDNCIEEINKRKLY